MSRKKVGPTRKLAQLSAYVDDDIFASVDELAVLCGCSRSEMVEKLLRESLHDNEWLIRRIVVPLEAMKKSIRDFRFGSLKRA